MPPSAQRFLERICISNKRSAGGPVLHNLDDPLISRLREGRPYTDPARECYVAVALVLGVPGGC